MFKWFLVIIIVFVNSDNKIEEQHIKYNFNDPKKNDIECNRLKLTKEFKETYQSYSEVKNLLHQDMKCIGIPDKTYSVT